MIYEVPSERKDLDYFMLPKKKYVIKNKQKCFINILLFLISSIVCLSFAELLAKKLLKIPSYSSFYARYLIDGCPSHVQGYVCEDKTMPFALKPYFSHVISDNYYHPLPFKVRLDKYGFRNSGNPIDGIYDNVIVGDSVAFGYGVNDDQTISSVLSRKKKQKIYNLAIPGAGPAMYVQMIDRFLKRAKTKKITVLFYDNDYNNLRYACWEKGTLEALLKTKIYRRDVSERPAHPPVFAIKSRRLRSSSFFFGIYECFSARRSINTLPKDDNSNEDLEQAESFRIRALKYLNELVVAECVDQKSKEKLLSIIKAMEKDEKERHENLLQTMTNLTLNLIQKNCYPIGSDKINLVSYAHGYVYKYVNYEKMKKVVTKGNSKYTICQSKCKMTVETKTDIFLEYLVSLQESGIEVELVIIPSEYSLKKDYFQAGREVPPLCERADQYNISYFNLIPYLIEYYKKNNCDALYLDGSHLTRLGNEQVVDWMLEKDE